MATAIVDGHYMLHRMMHVPQLRNLASSSGKPAGGIFGCIKHLRSTLYSIKEIRRVVVVFDGGHSERRKKLYPEYKLRDKNEEMDPDGLTYSQKFGMNLAYCKHLLPRLGIKIVCLGAREGDDTVGMLARLLEDDLKIVVSDDKDMLQLVAPDVHVWRPMAEERITLENFERLGEADKDFWLLKKACVGDSGDNIDGIPQVGGKTVDDAITEFIMSDEYVKSADDSDLKPPFKKFFDVCARSTSKRIRKIADNRHVVLRNYQLVDIALEEFTPEELAYALDASHDVTPLDVVSVQKMFVALEFFSLVGDFSSWITPFQTLR